jgi:hypothetical protein
MTGKNAVLVEHDAAAAAALLTQTNALTEAMDKYQISEVHAAGLGEGPAAAAASPAARKSDLVNRSQQAIFRQNSGSR